MEKSNISPLKATQQAMKEIGGAIIAITFLMASVFIPVAFMSGPVGIFYRQFSITMATGIILQVGGAYTYSRALCYYAKIIMASIKVEPRLINFRRF